MRDLVEHEQQIQASSWQPSPEINAALQQHYQMLGRKPREQQLWDVLYSIKHTLPLQVTQNLTIQRMVAQVQGRRSGCCSTTFTPAAAALAAAAAATH
jgi:hypothetical protein